VIRDQEGQPAYELVEQVRQLTVAYRLKSDARPVARSTCC
jgi:phosphoenolpyruvate carboxylase